MIECECKSIHKLTDVLRSDKFGVVVKQRWHKCFFCGKYKLSKWIRFHEAKCDTRWKEYLA